MANAKARIQKLQDRLKTNYKLPILAQDPQTAASLMISDAYGSRGPSSQTTSPYSPSLEDYLLSEEALPQNQRSLAPWATEQEMLDQNVERGIEVANSYVPSPIEPEPKMTPMPEPVMEEPMPEVVEEPAAVQEPVADAPAIPNTYEKQLGAQVVPESDQDMLRQRMAEQEKELQDINLQTAVRQFGSALIGKGARDVAAEEDPYLKGRAGLAKQKVDNLKGLLGEARSELYADQAKVSLEDSAAMRDPNSPLAKLYRDAVAKIMPEVSDTIQGYSAWELEQAGYEPSKLLSAKQRKEEKQLISEASSEEKQEKIKMKLQADLAKELDPAQFRQGGFADLYKMQQKAERGMILAEGKDLNSLTAVEIRELASVLDSVLKGGVGTITGTEKLVPKTARGTWNSAMEWAQNNPVAAKQGGFAKVLVKALSRAKDQVTGEIQSVQSKRAQSPKFQKLKEMDNEAFEQQLTLWGLNADGSIPKVEKKEEAPRQPKSVEAAPVVTPEDRRKRLEEIRARKEELRKKQGAK